MPPRECVGTLCLISAATLPGGVVLSPAQTESMCMLADLAAREIEALYAINRRATEAVLLQEGAELLKRRVGDVASGPAQGHARSPSEAALPVETDFAASARTAVMSLRTHLACEVRDLASMHLADPLRPPSSSTSALLRMTPDDRRPPSYTSSRSNQLAPTTSRCSRKALPRWYGPTWTITRPCSSPTPRPLRP